MKNQKIWLGIIGIMLLFGTVPVNAQGFNGPGGFTGPGSGLNTTTISEAQKLPDHSPVVLQGKILRYLDHKKEKFMFKDTTGEVIVEIDWHVWNGLSVNENETVEIFGYIDKKGWWIKEIEVKTIRKL